MCSSSSGSRPLCYRSSAGEKTTVTINTLIYNFSLIHVSNKKKKTCIHIYFYRKIINNTSAIIAEVQQTYQWLMYTKCHVILVTIHFNIQLYMLCNIHDTSKLRYGSNNQFLPRQSVFFFFCTTVQAAVIEHKSINQWKPFWPIRSYSQCLN